MENRLILIGYWHSHFEPHYPDPAWFIDPAWDADEKQPVIDHLKAGQRMPYAQMGLSWCRFRCEINDFALGAAELTDGKYVWPEGLAHYLEAHQVRLPQQVIEDFFQSESIGIKISTDLSPANIDDTWWKQQKGWNSNRKSFRDVLDFGNVIIVQKDAQFALQQEMLLRDFLSKSFGVKRGLFSIDTILAGHKTTIKGRFQDYAGFAEKAKAIGLECSFEELGMEAFL